MNRSERLHNQGDKEQVITPELELSMRLRDTCQRILQDYGVNVFWMSRIAELEKKETDSEDFVKIWTWPGAHPTKTSIININIQSEQRFSVSDGTNLLLPRKQRGKIVDLYWDLNKATKERLASKEELETYKRIIEQSLPIKYKYKLGFNFLQRVDKSPP